MTYVYGNKHAHDKVGTNRSSKNSVTLYLCFCNESKVRIHRAACTAKKEKWDGGRAALHDVSKEDHVS